MTAVNPVETVAAASMDSVDADSDEWIGSLSETGPRRDVAVTRLHALLLRIARSEIQRRSHRTRIVGRELDDLAHQAAADALVTITTKLGEFRGESKFTTWAYRFVMFEVSTKLGRHFWRKPSVPLDTEDWAQLPDRFELQPEHESQWHDLLAALRDAVDTELTPKQRHVFVALVLNAVPLDALARDLGSSRNAIYKVMYDARLKLRARLAAQGYLPVNDPELSRQS